MSPFGNPWLLISAIVATAALYVVLPVVLHARRRFRPPQILDCPESGERAALFVNARKAMLTAAVGNPHLQVIECSLWPERQGCAQRCLKQICPPLQAPGRP